MSWNSWGRSFGRAWGLSWGGTTSTGGHGKPSSYKPKVVWRLKHGGISFEFRNLPDLERKVLELSQQPKAKRARKPKIVVPYETVRVAKEHGISGLQKLADRHDFLNLRKYSSVIEESTWWDLFTNSLEREKERQDRIDQDEEEFKAFFSFTDFNDFKDFYFLISK